MTGGVIHILGFCDQFSLLKKKTVRLKNWGLSSRLDKN